VIMPDAPPARPACAWSPLHGAFGRLWYHVGIENARAVPKRNIHVMKRCERP
jgi:hypothetical protein